MRDSQLFRDLDIVLSWLQANRQSYVGWKSDLITHWYSKTNPGNSVPPSISPTDRINLLIGILIDDSMIKTREADGYFDVTMKGYFFLMETPETYAEKPYQYRNSKQIWAKRKDKSDTFLRFIYGVAILFLTGVSAFEDDPSVIYYPERPVQPSTPVDSTNVDTINRTTVLNFG